jgi:uncharacterized protein
MTVKIVTDGKIPADSVVVEAFPSRGYVSTLAANHLIRQLKMDLVGHIECDKLDAVAVVHDGKPMHPIRIYSKGGLVVLFSELIIPLNLVHEFTSELGAWFGSVKPKRAVLLASVPGVESKAEHEILSVTTDPEMKAKIRRLGVREMEEGVLTGMSSSLMIHCCSFDIPATSLMVETTYIPDVLAAASLLKILAELLEVNVDLDELDKAGKEIEQKFRDNLEQMKIGQENYRELHQHMPMYR